MGVHVLALGECCQGAAIRFARPGAQTCARKLKSAANRTTVKVVQGRASLAQDSVPTLLASNTRLANSVRTIQPRRPRVRTDVQ